MPDATMQALTKQAANKNYTPPNEYAVGWILYQTGKDITSCLTDTACVGWLDAEKAGMMAYYGEMMQQAAN